MAAEAINNFLPRLVDIHNYASASSVAAKKTNWETLQKKVLRRLRVRLSKGQISDLVNAVPGAIEPVMIDIRRGIDQVMAGSRGPGSSTAPREMVEMADTHPHPHAHSGDMRLGASELDSRQLEPEVGRPSVSDEILRERDGRIAELEEANRVLGVKVDKLQQLVKLKDSRIRALTEKLLETGLI